MNDRLEDRLIDTLGHRAGEVTDAPDLADRAVAVGRRTQRRHRILVVTVAASLVAAIGIASAQVAQRSATGPAPSGPETSPTTPADDKDLPSVKPTVVATPSATETGTEVPHTPRVIRCRDIPTDEPPQDHGTDTTLDPETGLIEIWYTVAGQNRHHTIDYRHDKTCPDHRRLRKLISGVVATPKTGSRRCRRPGSSSPPRPTTRPPVSVEATTAHSPSSTSTPTLPRRAASWSARTSA
jgi:hypothetical protein